MRLKKNCDNKRLSLREYCVCVRKRERERERERERVPSVRNTTLLPEKGRTPENLWRFFFSVEEKERDLSRV